MLGKIALNYSPNFTTKKRIKKNIKHLIFHYTGMSSESKAIKRLIDENSKVSCHYFIKRNGQIYNVCRGRSDRIKDILNYLIKRSNKELRIVVKDSYVKKNDIIDSYGDNSKLIKDTRWNFHVGIYEALDKMLEFNS